MWIGANGTLSAQVYVDLGETNLDALKVAGVGVDGTAFLSADEGAIYDMASLPLVRVSTADFEGGNPVKARLLTKDVTGPSLLRANFAGDDLVLDFDEPWSLPTRYRAWFRSWMRTARATRWTRSCLSPAQGGAATPSDALFWI